MAVLLAYQADDIAGVIVAMHTHESDAAVQQAGCEMIQSLIPSGEEEDVP
jgi:hypothetical protein